MRSILLNTSRQLVPHCVGSLAHWEMLPAQTLLHDQTFPLDTSFAVIYFRDFLFFLICIQTLSTEDECAEAGVAADSMLGALLRPGLIFFQLAVAPEGLQITQNGSQRGRDEASRRKVCPRTFVTRHHTTYSSSWT